MSCLCVCMQLSITPRRKKGVMLLLRSAMRQPRNGNLRQSNKNTPRLWQWCIANIWLSKASHTERLITIIPCYIISNKFPRLLAEREIIANALFVTDKIRRWRGPNPQAKLQKLIVTPMPLPTFPAPPSPPRSDGHHLQVFCMRSNDRCKALHRLTKSTAMAHAPLCLRCRMSVLARRPLSPDSHRTTIKEWLYP